MIISSFKLEHYFAKYEFNAKYLLSSSDCDGFSLNYVLSSAEHGELELWNSLTLGYTESEGHFLLREAISRHYNSIKPDDVFVLSPGEANYILMQTQLDPGDHLVCMRPSYQSLYQIAKDKGCVIHFWEPDDKGLFNPDDLAKLVNEKTKLIVVNFPHNPTGYYPTREELNRVIEIASRHNTLLFSDEMYHKLVHNPALLNDSLCDLYDNTVSLWGMAKSFGLAGLRIGWVTSHNKKLLGMMKHFKDYLTICNSATSEVLSMIALNNSERFIEVNLQKIRANKQIFQAFVEKHTELFDYYIEPGAGSTAMVKVRLQEPALNYAEKIVKESGVMLVPSEMFEYGDQHFRIGFGRSSMKDALAAWEAVI